MRPAEALFDRLSLLGGDLILSTLSKLEKGEITPQPQDHAQATYVKKISKSMGDIDWTWMRFQSNVWCAA